MKADGELRAGTAQVWVAPGGRSRAREGNPGGQLVGGGVDSSEGVLHSEDRSECVEQGACCRDHPHPPNLVAGVRER